MSAETAAILDEAANVIRRNGLQKGSMYAPSGLKPASQCPVCTYGALAIAVCGTPLLDTNRELRQLKAAADALTSFLGFDTAFTEWAVPDWNDKPDRTAEQVIAALEGAARAEREATS
jgi:hypothetical protein